MNISTQNNEIFNSKNWVVVGASGSIGSAISLDLASKGSHVILLSKNLERLEVVYDCIEKRFQNTKPTIVEIDFLKADEAHFLQLVNHFKENYPSIEGVVFAIDGFSRLCPLSLLEVQEWMKVMHTNLNASFILTQYLLPLLSQKSPASLVWLGCQNQDVKQNIANNIANRSSWHCAYRGIEGFIESLRVEHPDFLSYRLLVNDFKNDLAMAFNEPKLTRKSLKQKIEVFDDNFKKPNAEKLQNLSELAQQITQKINQIAIMRLSKNQGESLKMPIDLRL